MLCRTFIVPSEQNAQNIDGIEKYLKSLSSLNSLRNFAKNTFWLLSTAFGHPLWVSGGDTRWTSGYGGLQFTWVT